MDEHVDVHDYSEVTWRVFNNVDPRRDCLVVDGPLDVLDHSSPLAALRRQDGHRRHQDVARGRATAASGPTSSPWTPPSSAASSERWTELGLPFRLIGWRGARHRFTLAPVLASTLDVATC